MYTQADWHTVARNLGATASTAQHDPVLRNTAGHLWHLASIAYQHAGMVALAAQASVRAERCAAAAPAPAPRPVTIRLGDEAGPKAVPVQHLGDNVVQLRRPNRPAMWPTEICPVRAEPVREG